MGDLLRFGDKSHRVTRIVPSRQSVTIDGKEGYLVGWIEVAPVPIEEQARLDEVCRRLLEVVESVEEA